MTYVQGLVVHKGFPCSSVGKESSCNAGDPRFNCWVGEIPQRREWQPALVFLPVEFHGQKSLVGYSPWGCSVQHDWATNTFCFTQSDTKPRLLFLWFNVPCTRVQCFQEFYLIMIQWPIVKTGQNSYKKYHEFIFSQD